MPRVFLTRFSTFYNGVRPPPHRAPPPVSATWWRVDGRMQPTRSVHRAPSYPLRNPSPPIPSGAGSRNNDGGGGMPRPRLHFEITSTSSTSRLITLSATVAAVVVDCGEAVMEVAAKGERKERRRRPRRRRKKIMK